jgi:CubicO group peptidase (beta-lactamase class C family)
MNRPLTGKACSSILKAIHHLFTLQAKWQDKMNKQTTKSLNIRYLLLTFSILCACGTVQADVVDDGCKVSAVNRVAEGEKAGNLPRWDLAALKNALGYAQRQRSSAVVVVDHGEVIAECYWPLSTDAGTQYANMLWGRTESGAPIEDIASLQKSIVSLLVGIALDQNLLDLEAPVSTYLNTGWSNASVEEESAISIRHLLSMTSGLTPALEYQSPAGTVWNYNTLAYSKLVSVLEAVTGDDIGKLTKRWLTDPLGMAATAWRQRPWVTPGMDANPLGIYTTASDLVRLGELMLDGGSWQGTRLVSEKYIEAAVKPSQNLNPAYGFLWWLNGQPLRIKPETGDDAVLAPAAPADMYAAQGALGRKVYVVPSLALVVVRLGDNPDEDFNQKFWELLMAEVPAVPSVDNTNRGGGR